MADGNGNGNGHVRAQFWQWVATALIAALVAYFTSIGALQSQVAVMGEKLNRQEQDLAELRRTQQQLQQYILFQQRRQAAQP